MGRKRTGSELLSKPLAVRVPEATAAAWRSAATESGLSLADWLRQVVDPSVRLVGRPTPRTRPKLTKPIAADPALLAAVAKAGNNLNQLARWANTHKSTADAAQVLIALSALERTLSSFLPPGGVGGGASDQSPGGD